MNYIWEIVSKNVQILARLAKLKIIKTFALHASKLIYYLKIVFLALMVVLLAKNQPFNLKTH